MGKTTQTRRCLAVLVLFLCPFALSGCLPLLAVREVTYRPSPDDPYRLWRAYITDSGLLFLCGSVDNDLEDMDRVDRVYNLALRLDEARDPAHSETFQVIQIDDHPSLQMTKGYLSDLCQFDEKRGTKRPEETGWTEIYMDNWDEGFAEVYRADLEAGRFPTPPEEPRLVLYQVHDSLPPQYLLMGRPRADGPELTVLLVLGAGHIEALW